jgi:hypothetical protein
VIPVPCLKIPDFTIMSDIALAGTRKEKFFTGIRVFFHQEHTVV